MLAVHTVRGAQAVEAVALHDTRGALALGGARHVDDLAVREDLGGQLLMLGEIGRQSKLAVDYYQPLDPRQRYFVESSLSYGKETQGVYQDGHRQAEYTKTTGEASFGIGVNVGVLGHVRTGWRHQWLDSEIRTGTPTGELPASAKEIYGGQYVAFDFDQMDRLYFATRGWSSRVAYFNAPARDYSKLFVDLRGAYAFGGGLHCSTADVYREGECLDYFPNRVEDPTLVRPEMWK